MFQGPDLLLQSLFAGLSEFELQWQQGRFDLVGSLLITLYLMWSPWHYMGQNYGIALMFLGRRGIRIDPNIKRLIHLSFITSFLLALIENRQTRESIIGLVRSLTQKD